MAAENYHDSLLRVLEHEGGYSNDAMDPGGPTNWGITIYDARMYWKLNATAADVRAMPLEVAKGIYKTKYWDKVGGDILPSGVDYCTFDYAVNSGVNRALRVLKQCRGTPAEIVAAMCNERIAFLHSLIIWRDFGRGWSKRVADVRLVSLALAGEPPIIMADGETRPNRKPRGALIAPPPLPRHPPKDEFEAAARAAEKED